MSQNGVLYDSSLISPTPILCRSWIMFNNTGTDLCFAGTPGLDHYETLYGTAIQQGALSCLTSFMPEIKNYQIILENIQSFPSDQPYELTNPSALKKSIEHFTEFHLDNISLRRYKFSEFSLIVDHGCQHLYGDHGAQETKGYLFSSSE